MDRYEPSYLDESDIARYQQAQQQQNEHGELSKGQNQVDSNIAPTQNVVDEEELLAAQAAAEAAAVQQSQQPDGAFSNVGQGLSGVYRDMMMQYWQETINSIEHDEHDFKNHQLPLARIKKVMKTDEDVRMISAEAPILFAKGCDVFITELTMRAWIHAEENKRRTLQKSDIAAALTKSDMFDFLIDVVPREEEKPKKTYSSSIRSNNYVHPSTVGLTAPAQGLNHTARNPTSGITINVGDRNKPMEDLTNQQIYQQQMLHQQFLQQSSQAPQHARDPQAHLQAQHNDDEKQISNYPMSNPSERMHSQVHQHTAGDGEFQNFNFPVYEEKY